MLIKKIRDDKKPSKQRRRFLYFDQLLIFSVLFCSVILVSLFCCVFFLIFVRIDIVYMPRARRCSAKLNINTLFPISLYHRSFTPAQGVQRELKMAFWVYMDFNKKFAASLDLSSSQSHGRYRRVERVSEIAWIRNNQVPQLYQQG